MLYIFPLSWEVEEAALLEKRRGSVLQGTRRVVGQDVKIAAASYNNSRCQQPSSCQESCFEDAAS